MYQVKRVQTGVDEMGCGLWTFRRSREPLATQLEGKVLKASWEREEYYFAVWEPELLTEVLDIEHKMGLYSSVGWEWGKTYNFFRSQQGLGSPRVVIAECRYYKAELDSTNQPMTPLPVTQDFLTAMGPLIPPVIYPAEHHGWECTIIGQLQGRTLEDVFWDVLGPGPGYSGWINTSASRKQFDELTRICTQVADQVVDAIVEMSKKTADRVFPDWSEMDLHHIVVLGPGPMNLKHIVLDKDHNFVGFGFRDYADFAPHEWIQFGAKERSKGRALELELLEDISVRNG
ncbi:hypothetical protein F5144DRAFT_643518 [Chaetomium tenue]|uniref:Uncharacterized protein n=1 Tax=Chaetomium tenue TaxID=1854479 RepID=A0ACB7PJN4_9PEZI|nr:hypothetical protein F5144DRAFT_643518 [Chaetomium globosum]